MAFGPAASAAPSPVASRAEPDARREVMISARRLTRRFGERVAVDDLSLDVPARSTFGLLGANGAGKTTFIRMVIGVLLPSEGELTVDGVSPARDPAAVQKRVGFVMETSRLYPELRVRGFLRFVDGARSLAGDAREAAVDRVIERFDLGSVASRRIGNLSKGYQQRVSLAQAFVHDPRLVIVDEPTGGLDPVQQNEVQSLLAELRGERTVVLCTHDLAEARRLASSVAVLNAGRLVRQGPTEDVLGDESSLALFRGTAPPA
jgi:ABC-2 type transport system ATP-binding protein